MARPTALGKVASVFDERIQGLCKLPIQKKSGLPGEIARIRLSRPVQRKLASGAPICGELSGPRQLKSGVISVARQRFCSRGDAQEDYYRHIKSTGYGPELLFHPDSDVTEA